MFLTWILNKHIQEHIDKQRFVSGQELYSATYIWYKLAFDKKNMRHHKTVLAIR